MKGRENMNFEKFNEVKYPVFLLDNNFNVDKHNLFAEMPCYKSFFIPAMFSKIVNGDTVAAETLSAGIGAYFELPISMTHSKSIFVSPVDGGYIAHISPMRSTVGEEQCSADIRKYISYIFAALPMVGKQVDDHAYSRQFLDVITNNSYNLLRTSQNLSALAKASDISKIQTHVINLEPFMAEMVNCINNLSMENKINVTVKSETNVFIDFNTELFEACISNVLLNSMLYTQDDNEITIKISKTNTNAIIKISDTGLGIKQEAIEKVFLPYYSVDPYMESSGQPSAGLGLAVVERAVFAYGGSYIIESEFGEGTQITLIIPLSDPENDILASEPVSYYNNNFSTPMVQFSTLNKFFEI